MEMRPAICAAVMVCAFPASAANSAASASIGPVRLTIFDTNLDDGIAAGAALTAIEGAHHNLTWRPYPDGGGFWCPDYFDTFTPGVAGSLFSFFRWGGSLYAATHDPSAAVPYSSSLIRDTWGVVITPNTRVTFELDGETSGSGTLSAWLDAAGERFADSLDASGLLSISFESGGEGVSGVFTRQAVSTVDIRASSLAPEPGTYALTLAGLLLLGWRCARAHARQNAQADLLHRVSFCAPLSDGEASHDRSGDHCGLNTASC